MKYLFDPCVTYEYSLDSKLTIRDHILIQIVDVFPGLSPKEIYDISINLYKILKENGNISNIPFKRSLGETIDKLEKLEKLHILDDEENKYFLNIDFKKCFIEEHRNLNILNRIYILPFDINLTELKDNLDGTLISQLAKYGFISPIYIIVHYKSNSISKGIVYYIFDNLKSLVKNGKLIEFEFPKDPKFIIEYNYKKIL